MREPIAVQVIGQCKHEMPVSGANHLRVLEGTVQQYTQTHPFHSNSSKFDYEAVERPIVGLMVNSAGYSAEAMRHLQRSKVPLILITLDHSDDTHKRNYTEKNINAYSRQSYSNGSQSHKTSMKQFTMNSAAENALPWLTIAKRLKGEERELVILNTARDPDLKGKHNDTRFDYAFS